MKRLSDLPLRRKLLGAVALTNVTTLALLAVAFVTMQYFEARQDLGRGLLSVAAAIATNSTAALSFGDQRTASENLESLRSLPHVLSAAIYAEDGTRLAFYRLGGDTGDFDKPLAQPSGVTFEAASVLVVQDIRVDDNALGRVLLRASLQSLRERFWHYVWVGLLILAASLGIGFAISQKLSAVVTRPILALASAARRLTRQADYGVHLEKTGTDEAGELTECFNDMLDAIGERDRQLKEHHERLEEKVRERTLELEAAREKAVESARLKSEFSRI